MAFYLNRKNKTNSTFKLLSRNKSNKKVIKVLNEILLISVQQIAIDVLFLLL